MVGRWTTIDVIKIDHTPVTVNSTFRENIRLRETGWFGMPYGNDSVSGMAPSLFIWGDG
jgi:hypothetical protein